jgi:choline kinase
MKAIILAAGMSSRLYPLTLDRPKCLLPVHGMTIIDLQLKWLKMCGIEEIVVVTGYLAHMVTQALGNKARYRYYERYSQTNNLYTLYSVKDELDDDVVILFSDVLLSVKLLKLCIESKNDFCLIIDEKNITSKTMRVRIKDNSIYDIGSHIQVDEADGNFIGIAKYSKLGAGILRKKMAKFIQEGSCIEDYYTIALIDIAKEGQQVSYLAVKGEPWIEIDDENDYNTLVSEGIEIYQG